MAAAGPETEATAGLTDIEEIEAVGCVAKCLWCPISVLWRIATTDAFGEVFAHAEHRRAAGNYCKYGRRTIIH